MDTSQEALQAVAYMVSRIIITTEGLRERTEHLDIFLFFRPSFSGVLFPMFCLLGEGECQILMF